MAGAGFKDWQAGEVVTAADVSQYLQQQTIMVFADSTARASAITSPSEGMFTYITGSGLEYYTGSSWTAFSAGGSGGSFSKHFLLMGA